jgi:hypothetical protein
MTRDYIKRFLFWIAAIGVNSTRRRWWHARAFSGRKIFRDDRDRWKFLGFLAEGAERYRVKVHCYVLMENHFHLGGRGADWWIEDPFKAIIGIRGLSDPKNYGQEKNWSAVGAEQVLERVSEHFQPDLETLKERGIPNNLARRCA